VPISRNVFDAGEGNLEMAILAFLRGGAEFAYAAEEIYFEWPSTSFLTSMQSGICRNRLECGFEWTRRR
jgi:hypothetical protein